MASKDSADWSSELHAAKQHTIAYSNLKACTDRPVESSDSCKQRASQFCIGMHAHFSEIDVLFCRIEDSKAHQSNSLLFPLIINSQEIVANWGILGQLSQGKSGQIFLESRRRDI